MWMTYADHGTLKEGALQVALALSPRDGEHVFSRTEARIPADTIASLCAGFPTLEWKDYAGLFISNRNGRFRFSHYSML